jgi:hypothetical protein
MEDHRPLVGQDQRAGRDPALGEVGEQPGGVEQVMPGPGQMFGRDQDQGLSQRSRLSLPRGRSGRRLATVMLARLRVGAARVRHCWRDLGQLAAERGVPPRGQRATVLGLPRPGELAFLRAHPDGPRGVRVHGLGHRVGSRAASASAWSFLSLSRTSVLVRPVTSAGYANRPAASPARSRPPRCHSPHPGRPSLRRARGAQ